MITSQTQRLDQLADERIQDLRSDISAVKLDVQADISEVKKSVDKIYKILIGNGRQGIIQKVEQNSAKVKILCWLGSVLVGAIIGAYVKQAKIDLSDLDPVKAQEIVKILNQ